MRVHSKLSTIVLMAIIIVGFGSSIKRAHYQWELNSDELLSLYYANGANDYFHHLVPYKEKGLTQLKKEELEALFNKKLQNKSKFSWSTAKTLADLGETHPPLYYWGLSFWSKLFGLTDISVRYFSIATSFFTVIAFYILGLSLGGKMTGLFSAAFITSSSHFIEYAATVRMHALTLLISALVLTSFIKVYHSKMKRTLPVLALVSSINLALLNSFLLSLLTTPILVTLMLLKDVSFYRKGLLLLSSHLLFTIYFLYTGTSQIQNLPFADFSLASDTSFFQNITASFSNLLFLKEAHFIPQQIHYLLYILLLVFFIFSLRRLKTGERATPLLAFTAISLTILVDIILASNINSWGEARAVNFLTPCYLIILIYIFKAYANSDEKRNTYIYLLASIFLFPLALNNAYYKTHRDNQELVRPFELLEREGLSLLEKNPTVELLISARKNVIVKSIRYIFPHISDESRVTIFRNYDDIKDFQAREFPILFIKPHWRHKLSPEEIARLPIDLEKQKIFSKRVNPRYSDMEGFDFFIFK